jgi:hypothetical protein
VLDWNAIILAFINGPGSGLAFMFIAFCALIFGLASLRYARISDAETRKANAVDNRLKLLDQRLSRLDQRVVERTDPVTGETF